MLIFCWFLVIRPWRTKVPPPKAGPSKNMKEDPVRLHQHYQNLWKHQMIPGENKHSQLRWGIREKMLGENPEPRVSLIL